MLHVVILVDHRFVKRYKSKPKKPNKSPGVPKQLVWIGEALKQARKNQDLTQEQLAERLGVAVTTIQFIEQSRRLPSLTTLNNICLELDLKLQIK